MADIEFFNPMFTKKIIPASKDQYYPLRLPMKYALRFVQLEDSIYSYASKAELKREKIEEQVKEVSDSFTHTVKKGESLGSIAKKYGVSVANIKKWNNLRKDVITPGQKLTIYRSGGPIAKASNQSSSGKSSGSTKTHVVKKGETLSSIANKYKCSVANIRSWNGIKGNTIKVGQKLKIKK